MAGKIYSVTGTPALAQIEIGDRYNSTLGGKRFCAINPTPGTAIAGATAFTGTTPTVMIYQAAGANRVILSGLTLAQIGTVAGGVIHVMIEVDTTNRYSAAGTAMAFACANTDRTVTASATIKHGATAGVAGAGTRRVFYASVDAVLGRVVSFDFGDGIMIGATGSILIHTWAATTAPSWAVTLETVEEVL